MAEGKLEMRQYFCIHIFTMVQITFPITIKNQNREIIHCPMTLIVSMFLCRSHSHVFSFHTPSISVDLVPHSSPFH